MFFGNADRQPRSKESAKERRRFIRDADNFVRCLTIKLKVELGLGSTIVPFGKRFELASAEGPFCERGAPDADADARRLPGDPAFSCYRLGGNHDAARDQTWPTFVLTRKDKDRIALADVLATIHRLLGRERERLRPRIANLGLNRECHTLHLAQ